MITKYDKQCMSYSIGLDMVSKAIFNSMTNEEKEEML